MNKYNLQLKCTSINPIVWHRYENDKWINVDINIVKKLIMSEFMENNQSQPNNFLANVIKECATIAYDTDLIF